MAGSFLSGWSKVKNNPLEHCWIEGHKFGPENIQYTLMEFQTRSDEGVLLRRDPRERDQGYYSNYGSPVLGWDSSERRRLAAKEAKTAFAHLSCELGLAPDTDSLS